MEMKPTTTTTKKGKGKKETDIMYAIKLAEGRLKIKI